MLVECVAATRLALFLVLCPATYLPTTPGAL